MEQHEGGRMPDYCDIRHNFYKRAMDLEETFVKLHQDFINAFYDPDNHSFTNTSVELVGKIRQLKRDIVFAQHKDE